MAIALYVSENQYFIGIFRVNGLEMLISLIYKSLTKMHAVFRAFRAIYNFVLHMLNFLVDTSAPDYKWETKAYVVYSRDNHPLNYSLDLLNYADLSKDNCEHYLFAYLGLYGKLPVGNHYTIEKITYDPLGVENKKCQVFEENYTSNGVEQESKSYYRDSERVNKKTLVWNTSNIEQLLKIIRPPL